MVGVAVVSVFIESSTEKPRLRGSLSHQQCSYRGEIPHFTLLSPSSHRFHPKSRLIVMDPKDSDPNSEAAAERPEEAGRPLEEGQLDSEPQENENKSVDNVENIKQQSAKKEGFKYDDDDQDELPSRCYERCVSKKCCSFCITRFPKTCAVFVGILVPLFALTVLSGIFGGFLCELESPGEIDLNNERMASMFLAEAEADLILNMTTVLPRACYATYLYQLNETEFVADIEDVLRAIIRPVFVPSSNPLVGPVGPEVFIEENRDSLFDPPSILINSTDLFIYMSDCGIAASEVIRDRLAETISNVAKTASQDLTFNWIRCFDGAEAGSIEFRGNELTAEQRSQSGQAQAYSQEWNEDREALFRLYFNQFLEDGESPVAAFVNASALSVEEATGGGTCAFNGPAGAWFWFVTQTTVGYGNGGSSLREFVFSTPSLNGSHSALSALSFLSRRLQLWRPSNGVYDRICFNFSICRCSGISRLYSIKII